MGARRGFAPTRPLPPTACASAGAAPEHAPSGGRAVPDTFPEQPPRLQRDRGNSVRGGTHGPWRPEQWPRTTRQATRRRARRGPRCRQAASAVAPFAGAPTGGGKAADRAPVPAAPPPTQTSEHRSSGGCAVLDVFSRAPSRLRRVGGKRQGGLPRPLAFGAVAPNNQVGDSAHRAMRAALPSGSARRRPLRERADGRRLSRRPGAGVRSTKVLLRGPSALDGRCAGRAPSLPR